jgi:polar amino acid transport system substrate-binding protein
MMLKVFLSFVVLTFLAANPSIADDARKLTIVRGDGDYTPYEMMTADNQLTGIHIEVVRAVANILKLPIEIKTLPWSRALHWIELGKADAITHIGKTSKREKFAVFHEGNVLSLSQNAFFTLKDNLPKCNVFTGDLKQLKGNKIGILNGYSYGTEFDNADYLMKDDGADTEHILFKKLIKGRFLLGIANINTITYIANKEDLMDKIVFLKPYMPSLKQYIAFSKATKNQKIASDFAAALSHFKTTAQYREILAKYGL